MPKYKKCERCELNYIPEDEEYCSVCKQELKLEKGEDDEDLEICPICGVNYMSTSQAMCDDCANKKTSHNAKSNLEDEDIIESEDEDGEEDAWQEEVPTEDGVEIVSLSELAEDEDEDDDFDSFDDDEDGEFGKQEDSTPEPDDDFDYVNPDDFSDDELEDDEEDEDDEDL